MKNTALRRTLGTFVALGALGAGVLVTAAPASAASKDGHLDYNEFSLNWEDTQGGAWTDFQYDESLLNNDRFVTPGPGSGAVVDNNAESYFNFGSRTWYVYTGAEAKGVEGWIPADLMGNFSTTFKNQVSSIYNNDAN
ncbi:hypothetical protein [Streptomyces sp. NBC_00572]|uniref:hypothetical protein n=1 Tax=Streptomyces sp. NBC_00572 TaxID=2903664 RepID=UPI0022547787|nr:hypothetical protein [Streptomyces sp. NBC_00572]MCX4982713.1 hypothetical protein [Streptomyces sp. NBC_00572]